MTWRRDPEAVAGLLLREVHRDPRRSLRLVRRFRRLATTPRLQAIWLRLEAHALRATGDARAAADRYGQAFARFGKLGDRGEQGRTAIGWTAALALTDDPPATQRAADRGRRCLKRTDTLLHARLDSNLANAWLLAGDLDRAEKLYRKARRRLRQAGQPWEPAGASYNLGLVELRRGRPARAQRWFAEARQGFEAAGLTVPAGYARSGLAAVDLWEGRWDDGVETLQALRRQFEEIDDERAVAQMHRELASLYASVGATQAAEPEAQAALDLYDRLGLSHDAAHVALLQSRLLADGGWDHDARQRAERARDHWDRVGHPGRRAQAEVELGRLLAERGDRSEADVVLRRAQRTLDRHSPRGDAARCRGTRAHLRLAEGQPAVAYRLAARAYRDARQPPARWERPRLAMLVARAEADRGHGPEAIRWARRAVRDLETLLSRFGARRLRMLTGEARTPLYGDAIDLVLERGGARATGTAVDLLSRARSPGLIEDLLHARDDALRPAARAALAKLRDELLEAGPDAGDTRHRALRGRARELEATLGLGPRRAPGLIRRAWKRRGLREWGAAIGDREVVLFDRGRTGWRAFVLGPGRARRTVALPDLDRALRSAWRPLRMTFETAAHAPEDRRAEFLERTLAASTRELDAMRTAVWEPLELDAERVILVPHGELHELPLEALGDGIVSRLPHPALLRAPGPRRRPERALLLHGPGDATRREVRHAADVLRTAGLDARDGSTAAHLDTDDRWDVLHVAAHGAFHREAWLLSGLQLTDGWVGLERLGTRKIDGGLLYLASCESGLTRAVGADLEGWMTAGLGAGARELLLTLWKVDDRSSVAFSDAFYRRWTDRPDAAAAATEARYELRQRMPHPYHWAPFTCVG